MNKVDYDEFKSWEPEYESLGLNLCDTESLLSVEVHDELAKDLGHLAMLRRTAPGLDSDELIR